MYNVFTLMLCQNGSDPLSPRCIDNVNRVAGSNIFIKAKIVNHIGRDARVHVGNAGNIKRIGFLL